MTSINLKMPDITELKPRITVFGVGGAGGNAVNNMIQAGLDGCDFVVANTDAQALSLSKAERIIQMGVAVTEGLGAGSQPEVGCAAAEEVIDEIKDHLEGAHMVFVTAGMGGGTGTGAAPVIARAARELGILTVGVVTKPFHFEGQRRQRTAEDGIEELQASVDTLIVIPNQNLFRIANEKTTFADAFAMADQVLYSGVACITDLMVKEGLINLDFADVRSIMRSMGKAMMGTGEASGEKRALQAAEAAIANPLLDETSMKGARGLLISITGGKDLTLFEVDEAATRIREEVDSEANIILGATFDDSLEGIIRVSVVATGIDRVETEEASPAETRMAELAARLKNAAGKGAAEKPEIAPDVAPIAAEAPPRTVPATPRPQAAKAPRPAEPPRAAPTSADPEVTIEPYRPEPVLNDDAGSALDEAPTMEAAADRVDAPYIPPAAEVPARAPRMPRVEEFPQIAQQELRGGDDHDEERRPISLLRRLASGLVHREDEDEEHGMPPQAAASVARKEPARPAPVRTEAPRAEAPKPAAQHKPTSEFAKPQAPRPQAERPRQAELDPHGRTMPAPASPLDDDQLEIPAFLRRQAN
ncbi:cell division protein FtsZ [Rhodobium orientis]|uniref:Cell division protein FtsZ n=1 Tax=Rhodobium orientis TaxID=34017 RepID=A0A327JIT8_9HYPH|nr:cell division protein FtsZ [Rhodobium orientis]MBB4305455.1 cell division protein FtsZ [Rhodobium orientis]MBK5948651.1 cell division protein FtsZ [Rhodobium orientis]RAI25274.1 cell division protein FtsZ [Rhodobium orientis]